MNTPPTPAPSPTPDPTPAPTPVVVVPSPTVLVSPAELTALKSVLKIGLVTFLGAFFGALTMTSLPETLNGWKALLAPALGAAIAAEITYIRGQLNGFLANGGTLPTPASLARKIPFLGALVLVCGMLFGGGAVACSGAPVAPQTVVQDVVTGLQAVCIILNASTDVPAVMKACNIEQALAPVVQQIVDNELAQRAAAVKAALKAGHAANDNGNVLERRRYILVPAPRSLALAA